MIPTLASKEQILVFLDDCIEEYKSWRHYRVAPFGSVVDAALEKIGREFQFLNDADVRLILKVTLTRVEAPASRVFQTFMLNMAPRLSSFCIRHRGASLLFAVIEGLVFPDADQIDSKFFPFNWWYPDNLMICRAAVVMCVRAGLTTQERVPPGAPPPPRDALHVHCPFSLCLQHGLFSEATLLYETGAVSGAELVSPHQQGWARPQSRVVDFLTTLCGQPRSLRSACGLALSRALGATATRQGAAPRLPLPAVLVHGCVLFRDSVHDYVERTTRAFQGRVPQSVIDEFRAGARLD